MTTVAELTAKAAGMYLQSAVFIDDEIFSRVSGKPVESQETFVRTRKPTFAPDEAAEAKTAESEAVDTVADPKAGETNAVASKPEAAEVTEAAARVAEVKPAEAIFHPKDIVGSFAEKGIVCALYEPERDFKTDEDSKIFKLCQAADLVILDWDFHKDEGAKMRELVTAIVAQSSRIIPHHSRLVVIYTTTPSLAKVASSLYDRLKEAGVTPEPEGSALRIDAGATRIVVLGKLSVARHKDEEAFSVSESGLATRVVDEFIAKNLGILSSCALLAMAAVKRNSRRVLAKFSADMDGAFLLHRALLLHTDEAFEMLPPLLAEEFLAIVEDYFAKTGDLSEVVKDRVGSMNIGTGTKPWYLEAEKANDKGVKEVKELPKEEFLRLAKVLLTQGIRGLKAERRCPEVRKLSENGKSLTRAMEPDVLDVLRNAVDADGGKTNERLAALFNSRTYYDQQIRILSLGTVVRYVDGEKAEYSLCLVPVCDAVRLKVGRSYEFPFLRLSDGVMGNRGGNGCVVETVQRDLVQVVASTKVRDLRIERFTPQGNAGVIAGERDNNGFWVTTVDGKKFEWVAQLKPAHAQRVAHSIGQALSRVGLSEAEWVRILCDR